MENGADLNAFAFDTAIGTLQTHDFKSFHKIARLDFDPVRVVTPPAVHHKGKRY